MLCINTTKNDKQISEQLICNYSVIRYLTNVVLYVFDLDKLFLHL